VRAGKTTRQIQELKQQLDNGKTILVAGLKSPEDYLNRLGEGYEAVSVFSSFAENVKIGYKFRKI